MIANGGAEATNNFQRNINDGCAFVTLTYDAYNLGSNKQLGKYLVK